MVPLSRFVEAKVITSILYLYFWLYFQFLQEEFLILFEAWIYFWLIFILYPQFLSNLLVGVTFQLLGSDGLNNFRFLNSMNILLLYSNSFIDFGGSGILCNWFLWIMEILLLKLKNYLWKFETLPKISSRSCWLSLDREWNSISMNKKL